MRYAIKGRMWWAPITKAIFKLVLWAVAILVAALIAVGVLVVFFQAVGMIEK